jgi:hypothetical protein
MSDRPSRAADVPPSAGWAPPRAALGAGRAASILLRTVHLAGMAVVAGGAWCQVPDAALRGGLVVAAVSGLGLVVSEASHSRHWVYQGRGLFVLAHVGAVGLTNLLGPGALMAALTLGAVGSHLPKGLRAWSLRHRAVVD